MLLKMGGYLTCCRGNTSSSRLSGPVGVAGRLGAEDGQECETQRDTLEMTNALCKDVLVKVLSEEQGLFHHKDKLLKWQLVMN